MHIDDWEGWMVFDLDMSEPLPLGSPRVYKDREEAIIDAGTWRSLFGGRQYPRAEARKVVMA